TPLYTSPRWGNDEALLHDRGVWGAMATWQDAQGRRFISMSMLGPVGKSAPPFKYTYGTAADGSIMAFEVRTDVATTKPMLVPVWISRELHAPDVPVVANGVVYAFQSGKDSTETRAAGAGGGGAGGAARGANGNGAGRGGGAARGANPDGAARAGGAGRGTGTGAARGTGAAAKPPSLGTNAILYAFD